MTVRITVSYDDEREQEVLGFTFGESDLTVPKSEDLRPKIDFAISRLLMAHDRCKQLQEIANRRKRD